MSDSRKITASEQRLYSFLRQNENTVTIQEVADHLGLTKNSAQVQMSNLRKKIKAAGRHFPEPRKLARGGGGNSVDLDSFLDSLDESEG